MDSDFFQGLEKVAVLISKGWKVRILNVFEDDFIDKVN